MRERWPGACASIAAYLERRNAGRHGRVWRNGASPLLATFTFLVALDDGGVHGEPICCNDSIVEIKQVELLGVT